MTLGTSDSDVSDEGNGRLGNTPISHETLRSPLERHAFIFKHSGWPFPQSSSSLDLRDLRPLPSQIPFLLNVFSDNVNILCQAVHMPTVIKMVGDVRGDVTQFTPANEALMFAIYYAAISSLEDEEVTMNFHTAKAELVSKYRFGLEHALAKADFLNVPDLALVQAFAVLLLPLNRHESPRFVWMMTGLLIRMSHALGLHRDGTHFEHLTPYEVEIRRRVWRVVCALDVRASENQGTHHSVAIGSFDAKMPLNINDEDIMPGLKKLPSERQGLTDMSIARVWYRTTEIAMQMMAQGSAMPNLDEQSGLLQEIYRSLEEGYLQYSTESNITYWVAVTVARLVMAKMTLFIYLPVLFTSPSEKLSETLRTKLLVAAIEVAEYNHALNAEQDCRHWQWMFQSYTHWHATVYLLLEIPRRPWSPLAERAWMALHSPWLIPEQSHMSRNMRVWFPLQKLLANAERHRAKELVRLCNDAEAVERLEIEYRGMQLPSSPVAVSVSNLPSLAVEPNTFDAALDRWRQQVIAPPVIGPGTSDMIVHIGTSGFPPNRVNWGVGPFLSQNSYLANIQPGLDLPDSNSISLDPSLSVNGTDLGWLQSNEILTNPNDDLGSTGFDMDSDVNWYDWVESLKGMEVVGAS